MAKKKHRQHPRVSAAPSPPSPSSGGWKRTVVAAVRWGAWAVLLCALLTQIAGSPAEDAVLLGTFVIASLLYAISLVLERKYHW